MIMLMSGAKAAGRNLNSLKSSELMKKVRRLNVQSFSEDSQHLIQDPNKTKLFE